jgi:hypothetical protein
MPHALFPLCRETRVPVTFSALICHTIQDLSKSLESCKILQQFRAEEAETGTFLSIDFD